MIMLGKENPMVYTPLEIFNPTTANMVLQSMGSYASALRQDYKEAMDKEEQFMKEYGSFISPIAADQENYYNATLGGFGRMYESAARQGVDLLRSQEGRALILRYIMSRPYAQLALLRLSAETANMYKQLLAKGIADGTLDYETAKKLDGDISTWNTLLNGSWDKVAPSSQKSINQVLAPYIEDLIKSGYEYDKEASKKRKGYIVNTVSDQKIKDQLGKAAADIMKDPMMQLRVKESGLTPELFILTELYNHMRTLLSPKEEVDPYAKSAHEAKLAEDAQIRAEKRKWAHEAEVAARDQEYALQQIEAKNAGKKKEEKESSLHYNIYNQSNIANNTEEVDPDRMYTSVLNKAIAATDKLFSKHAVNGKIPQNIINSRKYISVLEGNYKKYDKDAKSRAYLSRRKAEAEVITNSKTRDSRALAIQVGEDEISKLSGVLDYDFVRHTMKGNNNLIFTLSELNEARNPKKKTKNGKRYVVSRKASTSSGVGEFEIKCGNQPNFIQQTERDGQCHWYLTLKNGDYYHLGVFDPTKGDIEYAGNDQRYLNDMKVTTKAVEPAIQTGVSSELTIL